MDLLEGLRWSRVLFIVILLVDQTVSEDVLVGIAGLMCSISCCIFAMESESEKDVALYLVVITLTCSFVVYFLSGVTQSRFAAMALLFVTVSNGMFSFSDVRVLILT